jgi:hypothetical protein
MWSLLKTRGDSTSFRGHHQVGGYQVQLINRRAMSAPVHAQFSLFDAHWWIAKTAVGTKWY